MIRAGEKTEPLNNGQAHNQKEYISADFKNGNALKILKICLN